LYDDEGDEEREQRVMVYLPFGAHTTTERMWLTNKQPAGNAC
jgi:hypothetical protein